MHIALAGPIDPLPIQDLLNDPLPVGTYGTYVGLSHLTRELVAQGHTVTVFTISSDPPTNGIYRGRSVNLHVLPCRPRGRGRDLYRDERRALKEAMRSHEFDVIHAHWTYEYAMSALAARTAPVLITVHDWAPTVLYFHRDLYRASRLLMQISVLARRPHLTANSPYIAGKIRRWYWRTVPLVPNGVPIEQPVFDSGRSRPADSLVIGALNNGFSVLKNVHSLIKAFEIIRRTRPEAVLRLAGEDFGPSEPAEIYARSIGVHQGIEFLGKIPAESVPEFMRSIDVFVHPSREESFGMVLVEAIANGALVVAGEKSGAVPWVLGQGKAGRLTDIRSPQAIADAVLHLPEDRSERNRLEEQAFDWIRAHFSQEEVTKQFVDLYREISQTSRSR